MKYMLSFLLCLIMAAPALAQPKIDVDSDTVDFGVATPFQDLNHQFIVTNIGTEPLTIEKIQTTCGCTGAVASATTLVPGATSIVSVTMTTSSQTTKMNKQALIQSNDPTVVSLPLTLIADVRNILTLGPKKNFDFRKVVVGNTVEETLYLNSEDGEDFNILGISIDHSRGKAVVGEKTANGYPITVTLDPGMEKENIAARMEIRTDHPVQDMVRSWVYAQVSGFVDFMPQTVYFGILSPGETKSRNINVRLLDPSLKDTFAVNSITMADDDTSTVGSVQGTSPQGHVQVKLEFTAPTKPGYHRGKALLHTSLELEPVVELPFSALVRGSS